MVDATIVVLISNTIIMAITAAATIYRIKIEKIQTKIQEENAEYRKRVETFLFMLEKEKDEFSKMTPREIYELIMEGLKCK